MTMKRVKDRHARSFVHGICIESMTRMNRIHRDTLESVLFNCDNNCRLTVSAGFMRAANGSDEPYQDLH